MYTNNLNKYRKFFKTANSFNNYNKHENRILSKRKPLSVTSTFPCLIHGQMYNLKRISQGRFVFSGNVYIKGVSQGRFLNFRTGCKRTAINSIRVGGERG